MAWTSADRDVIKAAILLRAQGTMISSVTFQDRTVSYQDGASMEELLQLLAQIEQALAAESGTPKNYRLAAVSKGV